MMVAANSTSRKKILLASDKQSGVVLVMALVMLAVLTLIGVSSMSSSTLEMKVAGNMQQHNVAFQAAQSRLAFAASAAASSGGVLDPVDYLINIPNLDDPTTYPVQTCNVADGCLDGEGWKAAATIIYTGCDKGFGSSLEAGKGFSYRTFEIVATGETLTGSSRSVQASGIRYPVKGCGDETL